ncbi:MAG: hypothetical protein D6B25_14820 [Desulfobulbaceae bacterium]|nr:MAG: hypothetical protein D6B25_14820 [Desulfobulbaceae bacterium]
MKPKILSHLIAMSCLLLLSIPFAALAAPSKPGLLFEKVRSWQLPFKPIDMVHSVDGKMVFVLTEKSTVLVYEANGTLKGTIPVEKGVTGIDTDATGEMIYLTNSIDNTFTTVSVDFVVKIDTTGSPFHGKADAPVTVAVFTDFE